MNGRDFLPVARSLFAAGGEAEQRSAVSRAYYAAFHVERRVVRPADGGALFGFASGGKQRPGDRQKVTAIHWSSQHEVDRVVRGAEVAEARVPPRFRHPVTL